MNKLQMDIEKRLEELKIEIQEHIQKRAEAQQIITNETLQIAAKEGAIVEMSKFLEEKEENEE